MGQIVFNIAAGRVNELYDRVENNDPSTAALVLVPIEFTGLEADATLIDYDNLSVLLAAANNEQTTMGRKVLTDTELATVPAPDDTNNRFERSLPTVTWASATGNRIGAIIVCYDPVAGSGTDTDLIPLTKMDFDVTPSGTAIEMTGGVFFRAKDATLGV